jgi:hypothetical protein
VDQILIVIGAERHDENLIMVRGLKAVKVRA